MFQKHYPWLTAGLAVAVIAMSSPALAQQIKVSQTIVEKVINQPYAQAVAKIEAAIKGARFMIIGEPNYQQMQRMVGRERRAAKAYFIFRPDLGTPVFDNDFNAAMEIPIKILIYEADSNRTIVRYKLPSSALADYRGLGSFGNDLDKMLDNIVTAASK
ncbi:MAG: DUF302 domain-containing protein [Acidobacteria bacterium]|nr:DUF302 domain-containing protein [Acidobacteriota bacterium]